MVRMRMLSVVPLVFLGKEQEEEERMALRARAGKHSHKDQPVRHTATKPSVRAVGKALARVEARATAREPEVRRMQTHKTALEV